VQLVHNSEKEPAHFVRMADRYALPFTIVAFLIAGIAYLITNKICFRKLVNML
jgi:cation transport ATPase